MNLHQKKQEYKGEFADKLIMLDRLAKQLRAERIKKGSVKFESEELHFDIDEHGKPLRCYLNVRKMPTNL